MTPRFRKYLFETLYKNKYLYRFASTVPFAGQWRVWQRLVLSRLKGHDVLELGCGLGDLLADMSAEGYDCQGIDASPAMVAATRETLRRQKVADKISVILGTAQHLPFSDNSFDTVVSTFPSEYIYDSDTIAEVARVLRPGGRLIVIEGANLLPTGFFQPLLLILQMFVYGPSALFGSRKERVRGKEDPKTGCITEEITNAWFGQHIPLEQNDLKRRSERVRSHRWEVYITMGEKT
ncbi:MAG TPA: class I SAM-dependent methyltransferase [Ktedonobacteraceae bacterium]|nr:class I SAM-dependent methyltransferase [Ktedonobacteraceae bacterium]